jgi:hypothetical protein
MAECKLRPLVYSMFQTVIRDYRDTFSGLHETLLAPNFQLLSHEDKLTVLTKREPRNIEDCVRNQHAASRDIVESKHGGLLGFIVRTDRIHCLRTALPFVPEFAEIGVFGNVSEQALKRRRLNRQYGKLSVEFAAELFLAGCHDTTACLQHLLQQAPDLVHHEVQGRLTLATVLTSGRFNGAAVDLLLDHNAPIGDMDAGQELARVFTCTATSDGDWVRQASLLVAWDAESVSTYRDANNNSLLHLYATQLRTRQLYGCREFDDCVINFKELLEAGISATDCNSSGFSALDLLLNGSEPVTSEWSLPAIFRCAKLIFPYFADKRYKEELGSLLLDVPDEYIPRTLPDWLELQRVGLEHNVLDTEYLAHSGSTAWQLLLRGQLLNFGSPPCIFCQTLADMCILTLRRGCDISKCIGAIVTRFNTTNIYTPQCLIINDCCYMAVLGVLLRHGVDVMPLTIPRLPNVTINTTIADTRSISLRVFAPYQKLEARYRLCKTLVLHYPPCTQSLIKSLMASYCDATHTPRRVDKRPVPCMLKLFTLLTTPRSLKFIAKRAIWRQLQRKQLDTLPLPQQLKDYLMEDETEETEEETMILQALG